MDDLQEIKSDVKELLQRSAVHNQILSEHKAYSIALQQEQKVLGERLKPVEKHVHLVDVLLKSAGAVTVGIIVNAVVRHFLSR